MYGCGKQTTKVSTLEAEDKTILWEIVVMPITVTAGTVEEY